MARDALVSLQQELTVAVDRDHEAYRQLMSARRPSENSQLSHDEVDGAKQRAFRRATDVPLEVMRMSFRALQQALTVAAYCHRPASSDVRVGIALIRAGFAGARSSAQDNLAGMADGAYVQAARAEIEQLSLAAGSAADTAERALLEPSRE